MNHRLFRARALARKRTGIVPRSAAEAAASDAAPRAAGGDSIIARAMRSPNASSPAAGGGGAAAVAEAVAPAPSARGNSCRRARGANQKEAKRSFDQKGMHATDQSTIIS